MATIGLLNECSNALKIAENLKKLHCNTFAKSQIPNFGKNWSIRVIEYHPSKWMEIIRSKPWKDVLFVGFSSIAKDPVVLKKTRDQNSENTNFPSWDCPLVWIGYLFNKSSEFIIHFYIMISMILMQRQQNVLKLLLPSAS